MSDHSQTIDLSGLLRDVVEIAIKAGQKSLEFYESDGGVDFNYKSDGSRVTEADIASHDHILSGLKELHPALPILSEESESIPNYNQRRNWHRYWLVDPIDGTAGFIDNTGEFTVNIALIENFKPILGVIYVPVDGDTYYAAQGMGAYCLLDQASDSQQIKVQNFVNGTASIIGNRWRGKKTRDQFISSLHSCNIKCEVNTVSSSVKFCRVAEGASDVYPAFGNTHEWDTAAGQCIVECAGGRVVDMSNGKPLRYNKEDLRNPWFVASGGGEFPWLNHT